VRRIGLEYFELLMLLLFGNEFQTRKILSKITSLDLYIPQIREAFPLTKLDFFPLD
jgi:hypothetical protein